MIFPSKPQQGRVSRMTRGENQVGLGQLARRSQRGTQSANQPMGPGERNRMNRAGMQTAQRLGQAERLVFVTRLAIAEHPDRERMHHCEPTMAQPRGIRQAALDGQSVFQSETEIETAHG